MRRVISLTVVAIIGVFLFYISRFWVFNLWDRSGLFGWEELGPNGGLVARWVRRTEFAPFELMLWIIGVFLLLTFVQKIFDKTSGH